MGSLEVIKAGLLTTVQDTGRKGLLHYGFPSCGAIDQDAHQKANLLVGNPVEYPSLECTAIAPHFKFHTKTHIALTGADMLWKINGIKINLNTTLNIESGDTLTGRAAVQGFRSYLAISGLLAAENFGYSYSTDLSLKLGGIAGKALQKNDVVHWKEESFLTSIMAFQNSLNYKKIVIHPGPEYDFLTLAGKNILETQPFLVETASNRSGLRLNGEQLETKRHSMKYSVPVLAGFIQLPPSGQPIVLLNDCQSTGGYPRIAYVSSGSISQLGQIPLKGEIRFHLDH